MLLLRNYQLIVAQPKYDALKTNICPKSKRASRRTNMLVLRTSRFHAIIRPIVPRYKYSIVFVVHYKIFLSVPVQKSYWIIFNFCRWTGLKAKCKFVKEDKQITSFNFFSISPLVYRNIFSRTTCIILRVFSSYGHYGQTVPLLQWIPIYMYMLLLYVQSTVNVVNNTFTNL